MVHSSSSEPVVPSADFCGLRERKQGPLYWNIEKLLHAVGDSLLIREVGQRVAVGQEDSRGERPHGPQRCCGSWLRLFVPSEFFALLPIGPR